jgi:hypothetical protein
MAVDPVGVMPDNFHSFNRYAYANNNPYKYIDPDGKAPKIVPFTAGGSLWVNWRDLGGVGGGWTKPTQSQLRSLGGSGNTLRSRANTTESSQIVPKGTTKEVLTRKSKGGDGGTSQQIIERDASGNVISRTHKVTADGKTVHQHQNHIGKKGGIRQFSDEWTGSKTINAPYENISPKFKPDRVPGGRTF